MQDRTLNIAVGKSRTERKWQNKKMTWQQLCDRLSKPTRTQETLAEYKAMSKAERAEVKDVGGFVAGYCENGNRTKVSHRSCLTLDADSVVSDIWESLCDLYGCAACLYSTHSHTPDSPRYRLIVPTDRDMTPDEYQAVSRRVADDLGLDNFDESTHQPSRLMYWGSICRDAVYVFKKATGELLSVDTVLGTYENWRDMSSWPTSSKLPEKINREMKRLQDPFEKSGLIGAFCRAYYPISEAIEAFVPVYEPCGKGRYTYTEGTAAAGVVIYEDKYSYSNHATDPASCRLCNAWDLVRIHKFGALDADTPSDRSGANLPSYQAMCALASNDNKVKSVMYDMRRADTAGDFDDDTDTVDWKSRLKYNSKGALEQTIENAVTILQNAPELRGRIAFDEMQGQTVVTGDLPWADMPSGCITRQWKDSDDSALRRYLEGEGLQGKEKIFDAVENTALENKIHPVKDFIEAVKWDGTPRIDTLFSRYLGAEDCELNRAIARKTLVGAVARIYRPGCKFDYVLTLVGRQGIGKSSICRQLAGQWFSDSLTSLQGKESYEQLRGVWVMELGELSAMKKSDIETIKQYITKQTDRYRPAFGRRTQDFPRQCIFVATTNDALFLRDQTGNRRFWIMPLPSEAVNNWADLSEDEIHQVWAEAKHYFDKGETLYLNKKLEAAMSQRQADHMEEDSRVGVIADYLERLLPENWEEKDLAERREWLGSESVGTVPRETVSTIEIYCEALGFSPDRVDTYELKTIGQVMQRFPAWIHQGGKRISTKLYKRQRYYKRDISDIEIPEPEEEDWTL